MQIDCNDMDDMTYDSCEPATGCLHTQIGEGY
jgi:hypothetical protein